MSWCVWCLAIGVFCLAILETMKKKCTPAARTGGAEELELSLRDACPGVAASAAASGPTAVTAAKDSIWREMMHGARAAIARRACVNRAWTR